MSPKTISRRDLLAWMADGALSTAFMNIVQGPALAHGDASLAALAAKAGLGFGTACGGEALDDPSYSKLILEQTSILVPENALKFDSLRPDEASFAFDKADALLAFADRNGLALRGHTLIWNDWQPDWLKKAPHGKIPNLLEGHIEKVMSHYAGRLQSWDVVNEPFWPGRDAPGSYRPGPWYNAMGPEYIFRAFARAAEVDPKAKLVLNEAWTERSDPLGVAIRKALLQLIDRMRDKGLRIDAIGLQSHLDPAASYDDASFVDFLHALEARSLDIYITEFDIDDRSFPDSFAARDRLVAERAYSFLHHVLSVKAVRLVLCWGLADAYTWWRDPSVMQAHKLRRLSRPLPFSDDYRGKPMRDAIARAFAERKA